MYGAVIGDIVGSRFEFNNHKSKDFELFTDKCEYTDDTVLTVAVAKAVLQNKNIEKLAHETTYNMVKYGRRYPLLSWGLRFLDWLEYEPKPYNSCGNGAAMRVSICGWAGKTIADVKRLSYEVTRVSHDHFEGIRGAECVAVAIWLSRHHFDKKAILEYVANYYPKIRSMSVEELRKTYDFTEICQETVPQALVCFFESTDFEDAIRNAISIGGDSDTVAAITGSVAEAFYGVPYELKEKAKTYLNKEFITILEKPIIERNI